MSALASLQRFGEKWRLCRHCLQSEWALALPTILILICSLNPLDLISNPKKTLPFKPMTDVAMPILFGCELRSSNAMQCVVVMVPFYDVAFTQ